MSPKPSIISPSLNSKTFWPARHNHKAVFWPHYQDMMLHKSVKIGIRTLDLAYQGLQDLNPTLGEYLWQDMRRRCLELWGLSDVIEGEMQGKGAE